MKGITVVQPWGITSGYAPGLYGSYPEVLDGDDGGHSEVMGQSSYWGEFGRFRKPNTFIPLTVSFGCNLHTNVLNNAEVSRPVTLTDTGRWGCTPSLSLDPPLVLAARLSVVHERVRQL